MDLYRSHKWADFRENVMILDGYMCRRCRRARGDGAVLQVHHTEYLPGHKPWDYPEHMCETICKGCHAAEHGIIPPQFGWANVGWEDLGGLDGTCELCGTELRYQFLVCHPKWPPMEVGTDCCDKLTATREASETQKARISYLNRRKTFVSSVRWREQKGDGWLIVEPGFVLRVEPVQGGYRLKVDKQPGKKLFRTVLLARMEAFDLIESGAMQEYLAKKRERDPRYRWTP